MANPQRRLSVSSPVPVRRAAGCSVPVQLAAIRSDGNAGRVAEPVAPTTSRRDPVRPGARPARLEAVTAVRQVRGGGCRTEPAGRRAARGRPAAGAVVDWPPPLRLTRRGRRVVAGLSIAIGLTVAAATVAVELGDDGRLELAGSATVVVQPGDTLWSLARELAPGEDARAVVDAMVDANHLDGVALLPGQVLRLP